MPLTKKGEEIKAAMVEQYGAKKGEEVFYASKNKGTITGVDSSGAFLGGEAEHKGSPVALPLVQTPADLNAAAKRLWGK